MTTTSKPEKAALPPREALSAPATEFAQQAEQMSAMSALRHLSPLVAAAGILGARKIYTNRQAAQEARWLGDQLEQNQVRADMIRQHRARVQRINQRFHTIANRNRVPTALGRRRVDL